MSWCLFRSPERGIGELVCLTESSGSIEDGDCGDRCGKVRRVVVAYTNMKVLVLNGSAF